MASKHPEDNFSLLEDKMAQPTSRSQEPPKVVLKPGLPFMSFAVHIVASVFTLVVLCLSFANIYAFDEGTSSSGSSTANDFLHALQFAVKLHEIIVLASLTSIVMYFLLKRLVDGDGIPLGLLISAYQIPSVATLFTKSMWSGSWPRESRFVLLLLFTIFYGNLVGPSSGIVLIPNLGWWPISDPYNGQPWTAWLGCENKDCYQMQMLDPKQTGLDGCETSGYTYLCPGGGFDELYIWANSYGHAATNPNITMTEAMSGAQRQLLSSTVETNNGSYVAIATTLHHSMVQLTGLFWEYLSEHGDVSQFSDRPLLSSNDDAYINAPVVQVQCDYFDDAEARNGNVQVRYPTNALNNFTTNQYPLDGLLVNESLYNFSSTLRDVTFNWIDFGKNNEGNFSSGTPSLGAFFMLPAGFQTVNNDTTQIGGLVPCTVDARWAISELHYDPSNGNAVGTNLTDPTVFARPGDPLDQQETLGVNGTPIYINPSWAAMLNAPGVQASDLTGQKYNTSMLLALIDIFMNGTIPQFIPVEQGKDDYATSVKRTMATVLSMIITDGLSRSVYGLPHPLLTLQDSATNITATGLEFQSGGIYNTPRTENLTLAEIKSDTPYVVYSVSRYGYAYSWKQSKMVQSGIAVLLIYVVIAAVFMIYRVRTHRKSAGWSSDAWGKVGELLALALVSSGTDARKVLRGVAGGVKKRDTWGRYVRVRERGQSGLEMVVEAHRRSHGSKSKKRGSRVKVGKKYW